MRIEESRTYDEDMFNMEKDEEVPSVEGTSEIVQFFTGRKILVTGGSGFLGKLLVEKLLRSCTGLDTLYMFMRGKKGKTSEQRFEEHFSDAIYARLKKEQPNFKEKIVLIEADTSEDNLGLSPENRERLKDTDIIMHAAATVRFDEKMRTAANINIRGTKLLLLFAKEMPNLKVFVHVSTAFSYCILKCIEEKCYEPPMSGDKILTLTEILNDDQLAKITPELLGKWPNTYAYTKAIGEDTVRQYSKGIPTCIVRPSIMISTCKEPIVGWINNLYGPTGVAVGAALGVLRTLHCKESVIADIIPADYIINNIIVAAWHTAQERINKVSDVNENQGSPANEIAVYNSISSNESPITWGQFTDYNWRYGKDYPSEKCQWYYMLLLNSNKTLHTICVYLLHLLPAAIVDMLAYILGKKPILWDAYKKIHKFSEVISYFATQEWKFKNDKNVALWNKLSPVDKDIFYFYLDNFDWHVFFPYYIRGLRLYLLQDSMDTLDRGRAKYRKLRIAHYSVQALVSLLLLWGIYTLLCPLYEWLFSS